MDNRIRILIVDDHTLFRESLTRLLEADTDFHVAHVCASVEEAVRTIKTMEIDVVLLDYDLSGELGIRFLTQSKRANFAGRVLMVTSGMSDAAVLRAIEDGVAGIFLKNSPLAELILAIVRVTKGETWIDPGVAKALIRAARPSSEPATNEKLSDRERDVLRGILEGLSNKEISLRLGLSESTIKASLQQLFARTGVRTRSQLVRIAVEKHSTDWLR
jgi:two-component system, NarL family, nitrate/nitrite response regulator NarL